MGRDIALPLSGETRLRAEVWVDGQPRTVSNHVFLSKAVDPPKGCGCAQGGAGPLLWLALAGLATRKFRRKSR